MRVEENIWIIIVSIWMLGKHFGLIHELDKKKLGLSISMLYLWDFETNQFVFRAFFDPVAKVSILLPSVAASISFHIQVFIGQIRIIKEVLYSNF